MTSTRMTRIPHYWFLLAVAMGLFTVSCQSGGVGDPCVPQDEYQTQFGGYSVKEVNIESRSFQCTTRVCLVNHFQGRVSCPYGQTQANISDTTKGAGDPSRCRIPGTDGSDPNDAIKVPVAPQLSGSPSQGGRRAQDTVYCSCRCDGPDRNARYCTCPSGFSCTPLVQDLGSGLGSTQLAGSYCVRDGTKYHPEKAPGPDCKLGSKKDDFVGYCGNDGKNP